MKHKGTQFDFLANAVNTAGGVSFDRKTNDLVKDGFMVGDGASESVTSMPMSSGDVAKHASKSDKRYVGGWEKDGQGFLDFPTRHPVTPTGETNARKQTLKNDEMAYGRVENYDYQGDVNNPYNASMKKGDVVASDDAGQRSIWADMPKQTGTASRGMTRAWTDKKDMDANMETMSKKQGQSFS